jgi:hypothetical protein
MLTYADVREEAILQYAVELPQVGSQRAHFYALST